MIIREFGKQNKKTIVLVHASACMWDYYEYVIPLLAKDYHLIVPALPGYDKTHPDEDFTSVEHIAAALARWLNRKGMHTIDLIYGCSMGGAIIIRMLADAKVEIRNAVVDAGITPYQLPYLATRIIAIRDFLLISMGKAGGLKLLEKAFSTDEYSEEDLKYIADVLHFMSYKTIWRTFESCNNYRMPDGIVDYRGNLQYWYGEKEKKDRAWDIRYMKEHFPATKFIEIPNIGHGSMPVLYPEELAEKLKEMIV